jgi:hypothetical protein
MPMPVPVFLVLVIKSSLCSAVEGISKGFGVTKQGREPIGKCGVCTSSQQSGHLEAIHRSNRRRSGSRR